MPRSNTKPTKTNNIVEAKKAASESVEETSTSQKFSINVEDSPKSEGGIILPEKEDLVALIQEMKGEIAALKADQAATASKVDSSYDLTDDRLFIAKPNGEKWEERRIVDRKTVVIDQVATAFYGPFEDQDSVDAYLTVKKAQRDGENAIYWDNVQIISGKNARQIRNSEKEAREQGFQGADYVNVLDRKIFADNHTGHQAGQGTLLGPAQ